MSKADEKVETVFIDRYFSEGTGIKPMSEYELLIMTVRRDWMEKDCNFVVESEDGETESFFTSLSTLDEEADKRFGANNWDVVEHPFY